MAVAVATGPAGDQRRQQWFMRYPPLIAVLAGLILAVAFLPSALNVPQSNPTETAEYAPVPPTDSNVPPGGNFSSLGLAESSSLESQVNTSADNSANADQGGQQPVIKVPSTFRCVGNRQTED